jgi:hypothetical protein
MANPAPPSVFAKGRLERRMIQTLAGSRQLLDDTRTYGLGGKRWTKAQIIAYAERYLAAVEACRDAATAFKLARQARVALEHAFLDHFGYAARAEYGAGNPALKTLGVPSGTQAKLTTRQLLDRANKAWETRLRNHTLGKQQKKRLAAGEPFEKIVGSRRKKR